MTVSFETSADKCVFRREKVIGVCNLDGLACDNMSVFPEWCPLLKEGEIVIKAEKRNETHKE